MIDPMPCSHPSACRVTSSEGTSYCKWCEDVARATPQWRDEPPSGECKVVRMDRSTGTVEVLNWREGKTWVDRFWWFKLPPTPEVWKQS